MATISTEIRYAELPLDFEGLCLKIGFPRAIHTRTDHHAAAVICRAMAGRNLSDDQREYRALLMRYIADFEAETLKPLGDAPTPIDALKQLMEVCRLSQAEIAAMIGKDASTVSKILHGHRRIQPNEAVALGKRFSVDPKLFLF